MPCNPNNQSNNPRAEASLNATVPAPFKATSPYTTQLDGDMFIILLEYSVAEKKGKEKRSHCILFVVQHE